mmetsp:Transcript_8675/g.24374  ORF Transcript_8675/g.24374 Transcript_8675/m.24374 type:complete len:254 (-) Transcript_8675:675-1436(-)
MVDHSYTDYSLVDAETLSQLDEEQGLSLSGYEWKGLNRDPFPPRPDEVNTTPEQAQGMEVAMHNLQHRQLHDPAFQQEKAATVARLKASFQGIRPGRRNSGGVVQPFPGKLMHGGPRSATPSRGFPTAGPSRSTSPRWRGPWSCPTRRRPPSPPRTRTCPHCPAGTPTRCPPSPLGRPRRLRLPPPRPPGARRSPPLPRSPGRRRAPPPPPHRRAGTPRIPEPPLLLLLPAVLQLVPIPERATNRRRNGPSFT